MTSAIASFFIPSTKTLDENNRKLAAVQQKLLHIGNPQVLEALKQQVSQARVLVANAQGPLPLRSQQYVNTITLVTKDNLDLEGDVTLAQLSQHLNHAPEDLKNKLDNLHKNELVLQLTVFKDYSAVYSLAWVVQTISFFAISIATITTVSKLLFKQQAIRQHLLMCARLTPFFAFRWGANRVADHLRSNGRKSFDMFYENATNLLNQYKKDGKDPSRLFDFLNIEVPVEMREDLFESVQLGLDQSRATVHFIL